MTYQHSLGMESHAYDLRTALLTEQHKEIAGKIWEIANRLRGPYRPPQYRLVMLPMIVERHAKLALTHIPCNSGHAGAITLALSRSIFARPYICRFIN
ncbi:MAG: hypothetical protein KGJ57_23280, partial [Sphingomonadales bacterium]|nr:hypothetical protein [Sphingomonadales bacterium]